MAGGVLSNLNDNIETLDGGQGMRNKEHKTRIANQQAMTNSNYQGTDSSRNKERKTKIPNQQGTENKTVERKTPS